MVSAQLEGYVTAAALGAAAGAVYDLLRTVRLRRRRSAPLTHVLDAVFLLAAAPALLFSIPMVQVFINSGTPADVAQPILAMPKVLAAGAADMFAGAWPLVAPWIGALGALSQALIPCLT